jgi:hypothetical protein
MLGNAGPFRYASCSLKFDPVALAVVEAESVNDVPLTLCHREDGSRIQSTTQQHYRLPVRGNIVVRRHEISLSGISILFREPESMRCRPSVDFGCHL